MAIRPLNTSFTPAELRCGRYVAAGLWLLSAVLLALLMAWSARPIWAA